MGSKVKTGPYILYTHDICKEHQIKLKYFHNTTSAKIPSD